jgi:RNA polymerase sigma-70 factor (ECF subfamily)
MRPEVEKAVEALRSGRPGGMEQALALLQNTVFSFSMKVCGHREDAEDTMQDVLAKAVRYLPEFSSPQALAVWLYTVAKNRCLMSRRRSKFVKETLSLDELMPEQGELQRLLATAPVPESALLRGEESERVRDAVRRIAPMYRLVLVLHDMEELSTADVARILGLREGTVRVRLHRARLFVRKELARPRATKRDRQTANKTGRSARCKKLFAGLSDYLDGVMDDASCAALEKHMAGCKPCEAFLADLRNTVQQLKHA